MYIKSENMTVMLGSNVTDLIKLFSILFFQNTEIVCLKR